MDTGSLGGILLALAGILAGLLLEGGHISQVLQPTAAMIVFGGTLGAVMLQFPFRIVRTAAVRLLRVFFYRDGGGDARSEEHTAELQSRRHLVCRLLLE